MGRKRNQGKARKAAKAAKAREEVEEEEKQIMIEDAQTFYSKLPSLMEPVLFHRQMISLLIDSLENLMHYLVKN